MGWRAPVSRFKTGRYLGKVWSTWSIPWLLAGLAISSPSITVVDGRAIWSSNLKVGGLKWMHIISGLMPYTNSLDMRTKLPKLWAGGQGSASREPLPVPSSVQLCRGRSVKFFFYHLRRRYERCGPDFDRLQFDFRKVTSCFQSVLGSRRPVTESCVVTGPGTLGQYCAWV